jgi:hypothetical protein
MWIERNEGSKFWTGILNELKNRSVQDILLAAVDGLTGFPDAINAVFPKTEVQLCIVQHGTQLGEICAVQTTLSRQRIPPAAHWNVLLRNGIPSIRPFPNRGGAGGRR